MVIPGLVVFDHALLDTFTGNRKRDVNLPVCTPLRRQHAEFDRRECRAASLFATSARNSSASSSITAL